MYAPMQMRRLCIFQLLHIIGQYYAGDGPVGFCDADGAVDEMPRLCRRRTRMNVFVRHILEKRFQINLLLIISAHAHTGLLTDMGDHGLMIHLCVEKLVEQMDASRSRCRDTYTPPPGEFGTPESHKRGHFFMP